jgi:hypothetical protein
MLDRKNAAEIGDYVFEFDPHNPDSVSIHDKSGNKCTVMKNDLYAFVFMIGDPEQQSELVPVRKTTITKYVRQHRVIAKKDIRKGEEIVVNCEIDVPTVVEEGIYGMMKNESPIIRT